MGIKIPNSLFIPKVYFVNNKLDIRDTDVPLLDIALDYGFSSPSALTRAFADAFGCTPTAYRKDNVEVMKRVEELVWSFDPTPLGYEWNEDTCQDYQRHYPEGLGYQILRPVRKIVTDKV